RLTELNPTDIVVHSFVRDAEPLEAGGGNWLLRNSQLAVTLWTGIKQWNGHGGGTLVDHYRKVYDPSGPGLAAMDEALGRLAAYAREHNIRLYLAMVPDVHNVKDYPLGFAHERVKEIADRHGYHYLDLLPTFTGLKPEDLWAMPGDPHPNSLGHER